MRTLRHEGDVVNPPREEVLGAVDGNLTAGKMSTELARSEKERDVQRGIYGGTAVFSPAPLDKAQPKRLAAAVGIQLAIGLPDQNRNIHLLVSPCRDVQEHHVGRPSKLLSARDRIHGRRHKRSRRASRHQSTCWQG